MKQVGVCLFDDPALAGQGWVARAGAKPYRIEGPGHLDGDTLWVTNLDYRTYRAFNLQQSPNIYDAQYFRTSMKMLLAELGLGEEPARGSQVFSEIFTRVVEQAQVHFGVDISRPGYRFSNLIAGAVAPLSLRRKPSGPDAQEIQLAIDQAYQPNQSMLYVKAPPGSNAQVFAYPREAYGHWLLSLPYPSGENWKPLSSSDSEATFGMEDGHEITGTRAIVARLKKRMEKEAVFFRVAVHSTERSHQHFATFGAGKREPRRWATLPEVLELARYARITVEGGYSCPLRRLEVVPETLAAAPRGAYSRGLLLENLWAGLSSSIQASRGATAVGAYMRAYDRVVGTRLAEAFDAYGFTVGSFGTGRIVVYVPHNEQSAATRIAIENRLIAPFSMTRREDTHEAV